MAVEHGLVGRGGERAVGGDGRGGGRGHRVTSVGGGDRSWSKAWKAGRGLVPAPSGANRGTAVRSSALVTVAGSAAWRIRTSTASADQQASGSACSSAATMASG